MKVTVLRPIPTPRGTAAPGQTLDLDAEYAGRLVARNLAEPADAPGDGAKPAKETADGAKGEKPKARRKTRKQDAAQSEKV